MTPWWRRVSAGSDSTLDELVRFNSERAGKEIARIQELGVNLAPEQSAAVQAKLAPKFSRQRGDEVVGRVHGTTTYEPFASVDFVVEAAFEKMEIKRQVFESLDAVLPGVHHLRLDTSSLSITRLARGLRHTPQILVTHFFNPPVTLPLVEVAGGVDTREDVITDTLDFLQGLRNHRYPLVPIRVKKSPGFVVNRLFIPVLAEACFALQEGLASAPRHRPGHEGRRRHADGAVRTRGPRGTGRYSGRDQHPLPGVRGPEVSCSADVTSDGGRRSSRPKDRARVCTGTPNLRLGGSGSFSRGLECASVPFEFVEETSKR